MDIQELWSDANKMFEMLNSCGGGDQVAQMNTLEVVHEILWLELSATVRNHIVPKFWEHFELDAQCLQHLNDKSLTFNSGCDVTELQHQFFQKFVTAVDELHVNYCSMIEMVERLRFKKNSTNFSNLSIDRVQVALHESLIGQLPAHFNHVVYAFYYVSFRIFDSVYRNSASAFGDSNLAALNDDVFCNGCNSESDVCRCGYLISIINQTNEKLLGMDLLDRIAGQTMTSLVQKRIKEHINDFCQGIFDRSHLKQLELWLHNVVLSWLTRIFNNGCKDIEERNAKTMNVIQGFKVKLTYFLYENFAHVVIEQFFSIIIDFPDSIPAIDDLKICMEKIDIRKHLIKTLKSSLEARILHPGVNTMDILTGYVAAIKAIRHLDSSGVILETVTAPIKEYLRKRSDTVRRVVTGLTEDGPTDLSEELAKGEVLKENVGSASCNELSNWENWVPDPFGIENKNRTYCAHISRSADIISMVVDIYGSKELFMNEYRNLMADRLLTQLDFSPEKEIRNLELLKLRFGETLLHSCEVMLKDVTDSKRINAHIQSDSKYREDKQFDITTLIISAQFWPSFNKESLELPEEMAAEFKKYTTAYESYKGNRTLNWRTVTGRVNIEIELGKRTIELTVPPTQAVIIYHFQHKNEWMLEELSTLIKVPPTVLRRRIGFWQTHGLISEVRPGVFKLIEEVVQTPQFNEMAITQLVADDEDIESAMASASDQREEELQVFWSYIVGMLTNLDSLPIERIHQMLKLFASHGIGVDFSQDDLKDFLQRKVREHKLFFSGGVYQLAK